MILPWIIGGFLIAASKSGRAPAVGVAGEPSRAEQLVDRYVELVSSGRKTSGDALTEVMAHPDFAGASREDEERLLARVLVAEQALEDDRAAGSEGGP